MVSNQFEFMKQNDELTPREVMEMPLKEFEERFNFRPVDAFQKYWFAVSGEKQCNPIVKEGIMIGLFTPAPNLDKEVVME